MFDGLLALIRDRDDQSPGSGAIPIVVLTLLAVVALVDRAAFEHLAILFIPGLGFVLFSYAWRTYHFTERKFLMILACGYLWVGILGIRHVMLDSEWHLAASPSINQSEQFLFSARALEAFTLLWAPLGARLRYARGWCLIAGGLLTLAAFVLISSGSFPVLWVESIGYTSSYVYGEIAVIAALGLALTALLSSRSIPAVEREPVAAAVCLVLLANVCFVFFPGPDGSSALGHLLKICALWLILHVVITENLEKPYREVALRERRFRQLYESSPISIWIGDLSEVYRALGTLRGQGVTDLSDHLRRSPTEVDRLASLVHVEEVNPATVRLFGLEESSGFYRDIRTVLIARSRDTFSNILIALYSGDRYFQATTTLKSAGNQELQVFISLPLPESLQDARNVPVSILDLTSQMVAQGAAQAANASLADAALGAVTAIAATIEKRDPYTAGHQNRVAALALAIARELGWGEYKLQGLLLGATIHDIGKIYVPAEILNRPGKLGEAEFEIIKSHAQVGSEIVKHTYFPWPIREMIHQHHERMDGSGYPQGLVGDQIVEEAQVIGVADVVEAITAHRPYRAALGISVGIEEIKRGRGTIYNPDVVDACLRLVEEQDFDWDAEVRALLARVAGPPGARAEPAALEI
ncbi:MAG: HD domain-containing protein [Proteobacteria bacterium]|nr:HD domain-containing protein [Pseudomonadota bacterium]